MDRSWDWTKYIDQLDIYDLRPYIDYKLDESVDYTTFTINEHLIGLQYYDKSPWAKEKVFNVPTTIQLDETTAKTMGLKGSVIPAGNYPVLHNEKNGTYNAIVSVSEYPIKREKTVGLAQIEMEDLNKFLVEPKIEKILDVVLVENEISFSFKDLISESLIEPIYGVLDPTNSIFETINSSVKTQSSSETWVVLFSPNESSLGLQFWSSKAVEYKIEEGIELDADVAKSIGIDSFKLSNEYMEQQFDEKTGKTTILIHRP